MAALGCFPRMADYPDARAYTKACSFFLTASGVLNYFEPEALVGTPYVEPDRTYTHANVGLPPDLFAKALRHGFEPLDCDLLFGNGHPGLSYLGMTWEKLGRPSCLLVDPYYGYLMAPHEDRTQELPFSFNWLTKYAENLPEDVVSG